jgi:branched-chain amino acid transport system substrate-binding protein
VRWLLSFSLVLFVAAPAVAQAPKPPVKIGVLMPYTGTLAVIGQDTTRGIELALAQVGGKAAGREIQLIKEDTEAKPATGLVKTRKLVENDRVDLLVGPVSSAVALAIEPYVRQQQVPLVIPVAFTRELTAAGRANPFIFRLIETTDQSNFPMGEWVYKNTPYRKVIVMASDFVAGRHSVEAFMAGFKGVGGEIVKEIYAPLGTADYGPFLAQAAGVQADAVYAWFAGADSIRFVKQYHEAGLARRFPLLGYNTLVDDIVLPAIGDAALGIMTVGHYSATLDRSENRAFVAEYERRHGGAWPTRYSELGYASAQLIVAAIESLKGELGDKAQLREALRTAITRIRPPRGPVQFDAYQQVITTVYVMKVERRGARLANAIVDQIPNVSQEATWKWWQR